MKSAPAIMATWLARANVHERREVARAEDHLHVGGAARLPEGAHFVVQRLPRPGERVRKRVITRSHLLRPRRPMP